MTSATGWTDVRGLRADQLAAETGFHAETLKKWARTGRIPGVNYKGCVGWRFRLSDVASVLARRFGNRAAKELAK